MNNFLFVYGTLLNSIQSDVANFLHTRTTFVGEGSFPGRLYDLGSYPGAVYEEWEASRVHGQVFRLHDTVTIFKKLDEYEGIDVETPNLNEYRRDLVPVDVKQEKLDCWVYLYHFSTVGLQEIVGGHYASYIKNNPLHQHFVKQH